MFISVVIPAYNETENITRTLNLLYKQEKESPGKFDYSGFEVIVVDNNSCDKTADKVLEFKNDHQELNLHVIVERRKGIVPARTAGFNYAITLHFQNEFIIASTDADTDLHINWLDGISNLQKKTGAEFITGDSRYPRSFWEKMPNLGQWFKSVKKDLLQIHEDFLCQLGGNNFAMTSTLYAKINQNHDLENITTPQEDRIFGIRANLLRAKFAFLPYVNILSPRRFLYSIEELVNKGTYEVVFKDVRKDEADLEQQMRVVDNLAKEDRLNAEKFSKNFIRDYLMIPILLNPTLIKKNSKYFKKIDIKLEQNQEYWNDVEKLIKDANVLTEKYFNPVYQNILAFKNI